MHSKSRHLKEISFARSIVAHVCFAIQCCSHAAIYSWYVVYLILMSLIHNYVVRGGCYHTFQKMLDYFLTSLMTEIRQLMETSLKAIRQLIFCQESLVIPFKKDSDKQKLLLIESQISYQNRLALLLKHEWIFSEIYVPP